MNYIIGRSSSPPTHSSNIEQPNSLARKRNSQNQTGSGNGSGHSGGSVDIEDEVEGAEEVDTLQQNSLGNRRRAGEAAEEDRQDIQLAEEDSLRKMGEEGLMDSPVGDKERNNQEEDNDLEDLSRNSFRCFFCLCLTL